VQSTRYTQLSTTIPREEDVRGVNAAPIDVSSAG